MASFSNFYDFSSLFNNGGQNYSINNHIAQTNSFQDAVNDRSVHTSDEDFFNVDGIECVVKNIYQFNWCGYVKLPLNHVDLMMNQQQINNIYTVHGDITYCQDGVIGFTTISSNDYCLMREMTNNVSEKHLEYRSFNFVKLQTISLAKQVYERYTKYVEQKQHTNQRQYCVFMDAAGKNNSNNQQQSIIDLFNNIYGQTQYSQNSQSTSQKYPDFTMFFDQPKQEKPVQQLKPMQQSVEQESTPYTVMFEIFKLLTHLAFTDCSMVYINDEMHRYIKTMMDYYLSDDYLSSNNHGLQLEDFLGNLLKIGTNNYKTYLNGDNKSKNSLNINLDEQINLIFNNLNVDNKSNVNNKSNVDSKSKNSSNNNFDERINFILDNLNIKPYSPPNVNHSNPKPNKEYKLDGDLDKKNNYVLSSLGLNNKPSTQSNSKNKVEGNGADTVKLFASNFYKNYNVADLLPVKKPLSQSNLNSTTNSISEEYKVDDFMAKFMGDNYDKYMKLFTGSFADNINASDNQSNLKSSPNTTHTATTGEFKVDDYMTKMMDDIMKGLEKQFAVISKEQKGQVEKSNESSNNSDGLQKLDTSNSESLDIDDVKYYDINYDSDDETLSSSSLGSASNSSTVSLSGSITCSDASDSYNSSCGYYQLNTEKKPSHADIKIETDDEDEVNKCD